jgi:hypothetical protein
LTQQSPIFLVRLALDCLRVLSAVISKGSNITNPPQELLARQFSLLRTSLGALFITPTEVEKSIIYGRKARTFTGEKRPNFTRD